LNVKKLQLPPQNGVISPPTLPPSAFTPIDSPDAWKSHSQRTEPEEQVIDTENTEINDQQRNNDIEAELMRQNMYKTELCRNWRETGVCRYGNKCQFAHGGDEIRGLLRHPKYKTEVCRQYVTHGSCSYGKRCRFRHQHIAEESNHLINNANNMININGANCTNNTNNTNNTNIINSSFGTNQLVNINSNQLVNINSNQLVNIHSSQQSQLQSSIQATPEKTFIEIPHHQQQKQHQHQQQHQQHQQQHPQHQHQHQQELSMSLSLSPNMSPIKPVIPSIITHDMNRQPLVMPNIQTSTSSYPSNIQTTPSYLSNVQTTTPSLFAYPSNIPKIWFNQIDKLMEDLTINNVSINVNPSDFDQLDEIGQLDEMRFYDRYDKLCEDDNQQIKSYKLCDDKQQIKSYKLCEDENQQMKSFQLINQRQHQPSQQYQSQHQSPHYQSQHQYQQHQHQQQQQCQQDTSMNGIAPPFIYPTPQTSYSVIQVNSNDNNKAQYDSNNGNDNSHNNNSHYQSSFVLKDDSNYDNYLKNSSFGMNVGECYEYNDDATSDDSDEGDRFGKKKAKRLSFFQKLQNKQRMKKRNY
jgi:hypothetical protein